MRIRRRQSFGPARERGPFVGAATSVHGIALGVRHSEFRTALYSFDLVTPDGQSVRWALNLLHGVRLAKRVYGPTLTLHV
jgi:UDP-N-acetyl-D-mannosaminuronic acid transferase (WecB/TagA/CpsF family)